LERDKTPNHEEKTPENLRRLKEMEARLETLMREFEELE